MDDTDVDRQMGDPAGPRPAGRAHRLLDRYHAIAPILDRVTMGLAGLLVVIAVLATTSAVLSRQFPAFPATPWAAEATTMCVVAAVLLVVPQGVRHNTHLAVTMLTERLGPRWFRTVTVLNQLLCAVFFSLLLWFGGELAGLQRDAHTPMLGLSLWWPYAIVALSGALMFVETVVRLAETLLAHVPGSEKGQGEESVPERQAADTSEPATQHSEA